MVQYPGKMVGTMDHFCVRLEPFNEEAIRAHLALHDVVGSKLETRYGAEGHGPSIYIRDPDGNTVEPKGHRAARQPRQIDAADLVLGVRCVFPQWSGL